MIVEHRNKSNLLNNIPKLSSFDLNKTKRQKRLQSLNKSNTSKSQLLITNLRKVNETFSRSLNKTYSIFKPHKPQSTIREKFLFDISQLQHSTTRIINKLKHSQSQLSLNASNHSHISSYSKVKNPNSELQYKTNQSFSLSNKHYFSKRARNINNNPFHSKSHSFRKRLFYLSEQEVFRKYQNVYFLPISLMRSQSKIEDFRLQLLAINDQLKLIEANINELRSEVLFSTIIKKAFCILNNKEKQKYNMILEETLALLIFIQPKILQKIYSSLDQILYCRIPCVYEESLKQAINEDECFILNVKWFNETTTYFDACIEVFDIIKTNVHLTMFNQKQYFVLKTYLDLLRYNTITLILSAKSFIDKYMSDEEMLVQFEEECELRERHEKKKKSRSVQHQENMKRSFINNTNAKINKISAVLDLDKKIRETFEKKKYQSDIKKQKSLLNMPLITEIMKYYDKSTQQRITAQRLYDRYQNINYDSCLI